MKRLLTTAVVGGLLLSAAGAAAADDPIGTWRMTNGKVTVAVANCSSGLCGTIVALAEPLDKRGRPKVDKRNPEPGLRKRPLIGLTIMSNMRASGDNRWDGNIYNADDGYTYSSSMSLTNANVMNVKGCVMFICKSMKFERVN